MSNRQHRRRTKAARAFCKRMGIPFSGLTPSGIIKSEWTRPGDTFGVVCLDDFGVIAIDDEPTPDTSLTGSHRAGIKDDPA